MKQELLAILACPLCKGKLLYCPKESELHCQVDKLAYPIRDNIPIMLADEARSLESEEK